MNKLKDIESMRVITMILVVFAHVTRMYTVNAAIPQGNTDVFFTAITEWIYTFHMPAFVAISGAVYYFVKRERNAYNDIWIFVKNKAKRLLIPYVFFAIVVVIPTLYYCNLIEGDFWRYIFNTFVLVRGPRHLWYLIMLFNLLVIFNLCENYIFKHKGLFLLLSFFVHFLPSYFPIKAFQLPEVCSYFLYFMIGYYFQNKRACVMVYLSKINKYVISLVLILLTIGIYCFYHTYMFGTFVGSFLCSVLGIIFLYIISVIISQKERLTCSSIFKLIDKNNFGLYLFHPMIIYIMFYVIKDYDINQWITVPVIFILSTVLSLILTNVIRNLGLRIVIGEK